MRRGKLSLLYICYSVNDNAALILELMFLNLKVCLYPLLNARGYYDTHD